MHPGGENATPITRLMTTGAWIPKSRSPCAQVLALAGLSFSKLSCLYQILDIMDVSFHLTNQLFVNFWAPGLGYPGWGTLSLGGNMPWRTLARFFAAKNRNRIVCVFFAAPLPTPMASIHGRVGAPGGQLGPPAEW